MRRTGRTRFTTRLASATHKWLTPRLELARDLRPGVTRLDEPPASQAERPPSVGIAQERDHRVGKARWIVGSDEVPAGDEGKTFGADRRGDHGLAHGERLED